MMNLFRGFRNRVAGLDRESGAVLVTVSVAFVTLLGVAAIAVDGGLMFNEKRSAQNAADHAAIAAAWARCNDDNPADAADASVVKNGYTIIELTLTDNDPSYTAQVDTEVDMAFAKVIGWSTGYVTASAVAECVPGAGGGGGGGGGGGDWGPFECVLALSPNASRAMEFNSINTAQLNDCTPQANSSSSSAIKLGSMDNFCAYSLYTVGQVDAPGYLLGCLTEPPTEGAAPIADPFVAVSPTFPTSGPCASTSGSTLSPGRYCSGLSKGGLGTLTLNPGTYYIEGQLSFSGIDNVVCNCPSPGDGVSFIIHGSNAGYSFGDINTITLNAPDSPADYPGMLLYVDPATGDSESQFSGIDNVNINGALYSASQHLQFDNINWALGSQCNPIVGNTVKFTGIDGVGHHDPSKCGDYGLGAGDAPGGEAEGGPGYSLLME
jgi:hypothetical protein